MAKRGRGRWRAAAGLAAAAAGTCLRAMPGMVGAGLVAYGLWLAWPPLGFLAVGGCLLLADRRVP
ncbi:hypothetical protein GCM10023347_33960 [Streptomyces chumphonensis]